MVKQQLPNSDRNRLRRQLALLFALAFLGTGIWLVGRDPSWTAPIMQPVESSDEPQQTQLPSQVSQSVAADPQPATGSSPAGIPQSSSDSGIQLTSYAEPEKATDSSPTPARKRLWSSRSKEVVGLWKSKYYGDRYLEIREDGTAKLLYLADDLAKFWVGSKLKIDYEWSIDDDKQAVVLKSVGGTPKDKVEYVKKTWGEKQVQKILELTEKHLKLLAADQKTVYDWTRIEEIPALE